MKMTESAKYKDTMRDEYDMRGGVRGKYARRSPRDVVMVPLDPDVSAAFPDAESVNEALRVLLKAAKNQLRLREVLLPLPGLRFLQATIA